MAETKPPQTSLHGPSLARVYHDSMKGDGTSDPDTGKGNSSDEENWAILKGEAPFPGDCHAIFDVEPMPHGCEQLYWPTWEIKVFDFETGELKFTDVLNNEHPEGQFCWIVGPDTENPPSIWVGSSGFRLHGNFRGIPFKARAEVTSKVGPFQSDDTLVLPWVGKGPVKA